VTLRHAFIDESGRTTGYYVCAAVTVADDVAGARRLARGFLLPNQRRWHFCEERDRRRHQILEGIVASGLVSGFVAHGRGDEQLVRAQCLTELTGALVDCRTSRVIIESRDVRDAQDKRTLAQALRPVDRPFEYVHRRPVEDPGLWLADAVAWSYSKGGVWRRTVEPVISSVADVGAS